MQSTFRKVTLGLAGVLVLASIGMAIHRWKADRTTAAVDPGVPGVDVAAISDQGTEPAAPDAEAAVVAAHDDAHVDEPPTGIRPRVSKRAMRAQAGLNAAPVAPREATQAELDFRVARRMLSNTDRSIEALRRDYGVLLFDNALIDTAAAREGRDVEIPEAFRAPVDAPRQIIHVTERMSPAIRATIEATGATIEHYVPHQGFVVTTDAASRERLASLDEVDYMAPFHPYLKMSPDVLTYMAGGADATTRELVESGSYIVMLFDMDEGVEALRAMGMQVTPHSSGAGRIDLARVDTAPGSLDALIQSDVVKWVEPPMVYKSLNDLGDRTIRTGSLRYRYPGLDGSGVIVSVADTGLSDTHEAFAIDPNQPTSYAPPQNTRVLFYEARTNVISDSDGVIGDDSGHGTHVSGSVLGNGALSTTVIKSPGSDGPPFATNQFGGIAPAARLVMLEDFNSFTDTELASISYEHGARLMNNSWGSGYPYYNAISAIWDELVRDADDDPATIAKPLIVFFAAGNSGGGPDDGSGGNPYTVGTPGNAKNVITVGAVEQFRLANNLPGSVARTDSDYQVAGFSSCGPTPDGRVKPDIMAPGVYVMSVQSRDVDSDHVTFPENVDWDYESGNLRSGTNYAAMSGTSMACPITTGAGTLLYQAYSNRFAVAPSPAMMKAMMVNSAVEMSTLTYGNLDPTRPQVADGWGMLDLLRAVDGPASSADADLQLYDEVDAVDGNPDNDTKLTYRVDNDNAGALKITIAWSDAPGVPGAASGLALQNNIDLVVHDPLGNTYLGNFMGKRGWGSSSYPISSSDYRAFPDEYHGQSGDVLNNLEQVIIYGTVAGIYTIEVKGMQIPVPGQPYAMTVSRGYSAAGDPGGFGPDIDFQADGTPAMAYSGLGGVYGIDDMQIFVRRWRGLFGGSDDVHRWRHLRDYWFNHRAGDIETEVISASVLGSSSHTPSIAVDQDNENVHVSWLQRHYDTNAVPDSIYYRYFNGSAWTQLGDSYRDRGICTPDAKTLSAWNPVTAIGGDGNPIVGYVQAVLDLDQSPPKFSQEIVVKRWNGSAWVGMDGSADGFVVPGMLGLSMDMTTDASGNPVVVFLESNFGLKVQCYRWSGGSWGRFGSSAITGKALPDRPRIARSGSSYYVVWTEAPVSGQTAITVRMATSSGGAWAGIGGSKDYPGLSGTDASPENPQVGFGDGELCVAWQNGITNGNAVQLKVWSGSDWEGIDDSDGANGVTKSSGANTLNALGVNRYGLPVLAVENTRSGLSEVMAYGVVGQMGAPIFTGIQTATGSSSNVVHLGWNRAIDLINEITYHIYRTPGNGYDPASTNRPAADDPDAIAACFGNEIDTVDDLTAFDVTGLPDDRIWYFGVRAENQAGLIEHNEKMLLAGPYDLGGDADGDWLPAAKEIVVGTDPVNFDSDGDGMWDGWEWTYSTNNPGHTNLLVLNPIDDGTTIAGQGPYDDLDGDSMLNIEEFQYWLDNTSGTPYTPAGAANPTNWWLDPTNPDTDGDGMNDGWEYLNGLNPGDASDATGDLDGDGLTNEDEKLWGSDPNHKDSDYDGVEDGDEVTNGTFPADPDTDDDGIDDGDEYAYMGDPLDQDSNNNDLMDGAEFQLGYTDLTHTNWLVEFLPASDGSGLLVEDCETDSYTNWLFSTSVGMWHRTQTDPAPPSVAGGIGPDSIRIIPVHEHTTNHSFRCAVDTTPFTNLNATYDLRGEFVQAELLSPPFNVVTSRVASVYVSWVEYYETERFQDVCEVYATRDNGREWILVSTPDVSGVSDGWVYRTADLSDFVSDFEVRIKFQFKTKNNINNDFRGWWVDDIKIFGAGRIFGTVRDVNGSPIPGARVLAIGQGGLTNVLDGHSYMFPGKRFNEAVADTRGRYAFNGLVRGEYYVKATAPGFASEFWNGVLYTNTEYYLAFGQHVNPGVPNVHDAVNGLADVDVYLSDMIKADFEVEPGANGGRLGVLYPAETREVYLSQFEAETVVWNGVTNAPGSTTVQWAVYTTTNALMGINSPSYYTNPVLPALIDNVAAGQHAVWLHPNWPELPYIPRVKEPVRSGEENITQEGVIVRDGEVTVVNVRTNQSMSRIDVRADVAGYAILVDGRDTGLLTREKASPVSVGVKEGYHFVTLVPNDGNRRWVAPLSLDAPRSGRAEARFTLAQTDGPLGSATVTTRDINGNTLTNATVYLNGVPITEDDTLSGRTTTPVTVVNVLPGTHSFTIRRSGYRFAGMQMLRINASVETETVVVLSEADADYDRVGDALEIEGYTNIFAYSGIDDPDGDGIDSATEYEQFRLHNVRMDIFDADTDGDLLTDGYELGYDGKAGSYGLSVLAEPATFNGAVLDVRFVGRFLDGVSGLPVPSDFGSLYTNGPQLSLEGDSVLATNAVWSKDDFGSPIIAYDVPREGVTADILGMSHIEGTAVYSDTYPDQVDSDYDAMWDGWEFMFGERTESVVWSNQMALLRPEIPFMDADLDPLENANTHDDPDFDGLINAREFEGIDGVANTNDTTRPDLQDTDGDTMPDGWEYDHLLDPLDPSDATEDPDEDTLINVDEWLSGTDPQDPDTDGDLISDGEEVHVYGTSPTLPDTDLDGLLDGQEVIDRDLDPTPADGGFFPEWNGGDMDNDGFADGPTDWDTDGDGMPDWFEVMDSFGNIRPDDARLNPSDPYDGPRDEDNDGLSNYEEYLVRNGRVGRSPNDFLDPPPIYGGVNGVVVIEMEDAGETVDPWFGEGWLFGNTYSNYTGIGYLTSTAMFDNAWLEPYSADIRFYFEVDALGTYTFELRHRHADPDPDVENQVWVRVDGDDGGQWRLTTSLNAVTNGWTYDIVQEDSFATVVTNTFALAPGLHTIDFGFASGNNSIDRFHLYEPSVADRPGETSGVSDVVGFVPVIDFVWDHPTNPFDPDSDGDGMPDGWEVWYGLHPMDPIPAPETGAGFLIRYEDLWLFGDIDFDGVENRNEYDYRFVLDPDADANAILGSLHPWVGDTDEDGLIDGEEIKQMRSHPLAQDSDNDGLMDGQGVSNLLGEVQTAYSTDTNAPMAFDRALNDVWTLIPTPGGMGTYTWAQRSADGDVSWADVFAATNGAVAFESDDWPFLNRDPREDVPVTYWGFDNWVQGFFGNGYLTYDNFKLLDGYDDNPVDPMDELLVFKVNITEQDSYRINLHALYGFNFLDPDDPYYKNSLLIKIDAGSWRKAVVAQSSPVDTWSWETWWVTGQTDEDPEGLLLPMFASLDVGIHTIQISGRSYGVALDRIVLTSGEYGEADLPSIPDSAILAEPFPLRPKRRWAATGAGGTGFKFKDTGQGTYVGTPTIGGVAPVKQVLVESGSFSVFGGRRGPQTFPEIWELRGGTLWQPVTPAPFILGTGNLFGSAGDSELATATRPYTISEVGHGRRLISRPRPGTSAGYVYYDGDPDSEPIEIWNGEKVNASEINFLTGWDTNHVYYGGEAHDAVEIYGLPYLLNWQHKFHPPDNDPYFIHRWKAQSDAYQTLQSAPALDHLPGARILPIGASTSAVISTGINIGPVLNSWWDFSDRFGDKYVVNSGMTAFLELEAEGYAQVVEFKVIVWGEMTATNNMTSAENSVPHGYYTSPTDYLSDITAAPAQRKTGDGAVIIDPFDPNPPPVTAWAFNSPTTTITIPATPAGEKVVINVTSHVRAMLLAKDPDDGTWELGGNMGFVIVGLSSDPGVLWFRENSARLTIALSDPPWKREPDVITTTLPPTMVPHRRKSAGETYDQNNSLFTMFGGVDGSRVLDDTWVSADGYVWTILYPLHRPPARWGHGMCSAGEGVLVYGGFDKDNKPLSDLWLWDGTDWEEVTVFMNSESGEDVPNNNKPPARGGMAFDISGGRPVMFGGTDGNRYFNDTWSVWDPVSRLDDGRLASRWLLTDPMGENSHAPAPRAFAAAATALGGMTMFGGRTGTLPTAEDTDQDWVNDGDEVALGGPEAGRDPRANGLITQSAILNTNAMEQIPFAFLQLGGVPYGAYGEFPFCPPRVGYIADFESLEHPHLPGNFGPEWNQFLMWCYPGEGRKTPPPTIFPSETGYDAMSPEMTSLWWHRYGLGLGDPDDSRDEWELGAVKGDPTGGSAIPPQAYSGRWCYGTDLDGDYQDSTAQVLYTPLIDLSLPPVLTTDQSNSNDWYLVFHEWLDLNDEGDNVRIEAIRPSTAADFSQRQPGTEDGETYEEDQEAIVTVLPNRNSAANTEGEWRRVVVPLTLKEEGLYFRFIMDSDGIGNAGGWYIDDVAFVQAGAIYGTYAGSAPIELYGSQGTMPMRTTQASGGAYDFIFLPAGDYEVGAADGASTVPLTIGGGGAWRGIVSEILISEITISSMSMSPAPQITWTAIPNVTYEIQYTTPDQIIAGTWTPLGLRTPTTSTGEYTDLAVGGDASRLYRVVLVPTP